MFDVKDLGVPAFVLDVSDEGELRYVAISLAHESVSGLRCVDMAGRKPAECLPPDVARHVETHYRHCVETAALYEYEEETALPSGVIWWRTSLLPILDPASGRVRGIFGLGVDITARVRAEEALRSAAYVDVLTGIGNRRRFERDLDRVVAAAEETGRAFSIILADVDRFKSVNDTHGHAAGDAVLREVAARFEGGLRDYDKVARIGGDEFAAILSAGTQADIAGALARIRDRMTGSIRAGDLDLDVRISFGAALWRPGMTALDIAKAADLQMYAEKERLRAAA